MLVWNVKLQEYLTKEGTWVADKEKAGRFSPTKALHLAMSLRNPDMWVVTRRPFQFK